MSLAVDLSELYTGDDGGIVFAMRPMVSSEVGHQRSISKPDRVHRHRGRRVGLLLRLVYSKF